MAQKKFSIQQTALVNGVPTNRYSNVTCEESEIGTVTDMLEGEYIVMGEVARGGTDANVTSYNLLERVTARAEGKANMSAAIFGSNGGLVIKNGLSIDEVATVISQLHMFEDDPTKKPDVNSIKPLIKAGAVAPTAP